MKDINENIDLDFLRSQDLGSAFIEKMLSIYIQDIQQRLDELRAVSHLPSNAELIGRHLHTLASHSRDLGLTQTQAHLNGLEKAIKANNIEWDLLKILELAKHFEQVVLTLNQELEKLTH